MTSELNGFVGWGPLDSPPGGFRPPPSLTGDEDGSRGGCTSSASPPGGDRTHPQRRPLLKRLVPHFNFLPPPPSLSSVPLFLPPLPSPSFLSWVSSFGSEDTETFFVMGKGSDPGTLGTLTLKSQKSQGAFGMAGPEPAR